MTDLAIDDREVKRLLARHGDIARHGAGALEIQREREARQERIAAWVSRHGLKCFKCRSAINPMVSGGRRRNGSLWVVCSMCVRKPKEAGRSRL